MKKQLPGIVFFVIILFFSSSVSYADQSVTLPSNTFRVKIDCSDNSVDLTEIKIDVYSSVISYEDTENEYAFYDGIYAFSVYPDSSGEIVFERPSDYFTISLNQDTLPTGYGVDRYMDFFFPNSNEYHIILSGISSIEIKNENGQITPVILDEEGNTLYAKTVILNDVSVSDITFDETNHLISYNENRSVKIQDTIYAVQTKIEPSFSSRYDTAGFLFANGLISHYEYVKLLSTFVLNPTPCNSEVFHEEIDGTALYWELRNFIESPEALQEDCSIIVAALNKMNPFQNYDYLLPSSNTTGYATDTSLSTNESETRVDPPADLPTEPTRTLSYVISNSAHFWVYYDTTETTYSVAYAVGSAMDSIDYLFYITWGFNRPYYDTSTSYYKVFIVNTDDYGGQTNQNGAYGSFINISLSTAQKVANNNLVSHGVLAHEYMHAIFYRYGIYYNTSDRQWMHECFATWAGAVFSSAYADYIKCRVNEFTSAPHLPLTQHSNSPGESNRASGSCVFPLYIQQQQGGVNTIKKILSNYASSSDPLTAISSGLAYYSHSLAEAFSGCATYNSNPSYFYSGAVLHLHGIRDILFQFLHTRIHLLQLWL